MTNPLLILASSSPRRKEILSTCGFEYEIVLPLVDETVLPDESPEGMVARLAQLKAETVARQYPNRWILGADTTVSIDGQILGKPIDAADAERMLRLLEGRTHEVWSGFCIIHQERKICFCRRQSTRVTMSSMTALQIKSYIATGEPLDKAGSYAVQGYGMQYIDGIDGSHTNVIGLNVTLVRTALEKLRGF